LSVFSSDDKSTDGWPSSSSSDSSDTKKCQAKKEWKKDKRKKKKSSHKEAKGKLKEEGNISPQAQMRRVPTIFLFH
jgi:hypothetical protein